MKRTKEEVDKLMKPIIRTAHLRMEARSVKGGEFPGWYSALSEDDKGLYKEILSELSMSIELPIFTECPNCREPIPISMPNI